MRLFVEKVGVQPVIYAGSFLHERGGATTHMHGAPLWLAAYVSDPKTIKGWDDWTFWQYTDGKLGPFKGEIDGVGPACDQNVFKGTQADLDALWQRYA